MKVHEILTEDYNDCVDQTMKRLFHEEFNEVEIEGTVEQILDVIHRISNEKKETDLRREETILNRLIELESSQVIIYLPKSMIRKFDNLEETILSDNENIMKTIIAIQEYARLLGKSATTEEEWEGTEEYNTAMKQAEEECMQASDGYDAAGMTPGDFA